jgi:hypothetical protein
MMLSRILEHKKAERRHKQSRGYLAELKTQSETIPVLSASPSPSTRPEAPRALR